MINHRIPDHSEYLMHAKQLLSRGNAPQAEFYLRAYTAIHGDTEESLSVLSSLEIEYGFSTQFRLSECKPEIHSRQRFLMIKAWGYGFWSEAHHLASLLLLAELTSRTPVVLWGKNCLFRHSDTKNSFETFFQPISPYTVEDLSGNPSIFPPKWNQTNILEEDVNKWMGPYSRISAQHLFNRSEDIVIADFFSTLDCIVPWIASDSKHYGKSIDELYSYLFQRYLLPSDSIASDDTQFFDAHMKGKNWIAVHMRGSDKVHESPDLDRINSEYFPYIDRIIELNPHIGIFLLTDYAPIHDVFCSRYANRVLSTQATRTHNAVGVHLSGHDGVVLGKEVFLDVLLATRCDYFIGNQESNVSQAIRSFGNWRQGYAFLLGSKSIRESNLFLHNRAVG